MLHLSQMIDDANTAVTDVRLAHDRSVMSLMLRTDLNEAQKKELVALFSPVVEAIKVAQPKFSYNV